jgi:hypothetical protein
MKLTIKILTMILALAMVFSLCACSSGSSTNDDDDDDDDKLARPTAPVTDVTEETEPTEETLPDEPSAEDQAVLDAYCENLYNFCFASDPVEQDSYYQQLKALDLTVIDKWRNTEFEPAEYRYHKINWDYEAVFNAITVVENVMLNQKTYYTDFIGNVTEDYYFPSWSYNEDGLVVGASNETWAYEIFPSNPAGLSGKREYTMNDAGQITEIRFSSNGIANHLVTLTYDENGNKIKETVTDTDGDSFDILYTYDEANRLTRIDCDTHYPSTYEYIYSPDGKLAESKYSQKCGCLYTETTVYSYDESGNLISGIVTNDTWSNDFFVSEQHVERTRQSQYTFTCDEEGNIVQIDIVKGDEYYVAGWFAGDVSSAASHALITINIAYGNYYSFDWHQLFTIG